MNIRLISLLFIFTMILVAGCTASSPPPTPELTPGEELLTITHNTQAMHEDLTIGSGNAWFEDFTDESGKATKRWRAALWVNQADQGQTVHIGDVLTSDGYQIRVLNISNTAVTLAISPAP